MQTYKIFLCMCAIAGVFASPTTSAQSKGEKIFEEDCSDCHHPKKKPLDEKHMTRKEWQESINTMIEKDKLDPVPSKERISTLLDWLVANHGPESGTAKTPIVPSVSATPVAPNTPSTKDTSPDPKR